MLPIFSDTGRLAWTYNSLTINDATYMVESVRPGTGMVVPTEQHPESDGVESYTALKGPRIFHVTGYVKAATYVALYDAIAALCAATDPSRLAHENASGDYGYKPLAFSVPTADTTNYTTGLISCFYNARAQRPFDPPAYRYFGLSCPFSIDFMLKDPRRYYATQQTKTGAGTVDNSLASYRSFPTITITMAGAGHATYTYENNPAVGDTRSLVLNLSGRANGEVVVVNCETRKITVDGTENASLYVSGDYPEMQPSSNVISLTNVTNATTVTTWYRAFAS